MKKIIILLTTIISMNFASAQNAQKDETIIENIKIIGSSKGDSSYPKILGLVNIGAKTFESLSIESNGQKYRCHGAGGEIRCINFKDLSKENQK